MTERDYLTAYDPTAFPAMAVAVDVVILAHREGTLHVLLIRRTEHPARARLALPGGFVRIDEDIDAAAMRVLSDKAGVDVVVRQFGAFGAVERDPRMRIVSVGYLALATWDALAPLLDDDHQLMRIDGDIVRGPRGRRQTLPFDHDAILAAALVRLRAELDQSALAFALMPPVFTLRELQQVHEAVRGQSLNKPAFRKRLLDSGKLIGTGRRDVGGAFRPAELYRLNEEAFA